MLVAILTVRIPSGGSKFLTHHDSTSGVPGWFTPIGLGILLYLGIRMYFAVKKKK
jgi:hypothetical protein